MNKKLEIQELAIAIAAKNLNPTVLNPDFLKYSGIVPQDWEFARQPVYTNGLVQILFNNGLGIVAQSNRITIAEVLGTKNYESVQVAEIACQLVEKLSQIEYANVGVNPRGFVTFDSEEKSHQYLCNNLLSAGAWQEFGEGKMNAGLQLSYPLKRGQLNLGINQANIKFPEQVVPAILFSGSFNYSLIGETPGERVQNLQQLVQNWQESVNTFEKLVTEKFLPLATQPDNVSLFPEMALSS
ncbi:MAG: hypothetical protein QNJ63_29330 [Calothrix sp. MO_192.B10]|nr:hypothetical protein [Calothrix sp. MO_192.B10]